MNVLFDTSNTDFKLKVAYKVTIAQWSVFSEQRTSENAVSTVKIAAIGSGQADFFETVVSTSVNLSN